MKNFKDILREKEKYTDDDWVLVQDGKTVVKYIKNPKSGKAPTSFTSSKGQEMISIGKAKKDGMVKLDKTKLSEAETVKVDTLGKGTNKTVGVEGNWIVIKNDSREIPLNKAEANFLIRSLKRMVKEVK